MYRIFIILSLLVIWPVLTAGAGFAASASYDERNPFPAFEEVDWDSCAAPTFPDEPKKVGHGVQTFKSGNFMIFNQRPQKAYRMPKGFFAIGVHHRKADCVSFAPSQQGVFLKKTSFDVQEVPMPHMAHKTVHFVFPAYMIETDRQGTIDMVRYSFAQAAKIFPPAEVSQDRYWFFVTAFMMGNGVLSSNRAFAGEGPSMTTIERIWQDVRMQELSLHRTMHYFNRYNSKATNPSKSREFPRTSFEEAVASWAETVFFPDNKQRHSRMFAVVYPTYRETVLKDITRLRVNMRGNDTKSMLAIDHVQNYERFVHYMFGPVLMMGLEHLLAQNNSKHDVASLLAAYHASDNSDFMAFIDAELDNQSMLTFRNWLWGELIPKEIIADITKRYDTP